MRRSKMKTREIPIIDETTKKIVDEWRDHRGMKRAVTKDEYIQTYMAAREILRKGLGSYV